MLGFPRGTIVTTDQGNVAIETIDSSYHTINGDAIVAVTKLSASDTRLVCFTKDAFKPGYPSVATFMSPHHHIFFLGRMMPAEHFVGKFNGIGLLQDYNKTLYNVVTAEHRMMLVNNLTCETGYFYAPSFD